MPINIIRIKGLRLVLIVMLCLFVLSYSYAQSFEDYNQWTVTIKGAVIDSATKSALSHVTITAQENGKNKPYKTTLTNEKGYFELSLFSGRPYQLIVSYAGYKASIIQLAGIKSPGKHLGKIPIASLFKELKGVKVAAQKPLLEQDIDKVTYNVDADPESNTATALDILRKIPLLSVDAEDNLQLNGNNNFRIFINGRPSTLFSNNQSDIFSHMPANAIKTIEVMTVPPSRYEADGEGGIINIITDKKTIGGYSGSVSLRASTPKGYVANGTITATVGKLSFSGNYGYNTSTNPTYSNTYYRQDKILQNQLKQQGKSNNKNVSQTWGSQLTWELNPLNLVTISYITNNSERNNNSLQQALLLNATGLPVEAYNNLNIGKSISIGNDFSFDYQRNFKKSEVQQLTFSYRRGNNTSGSYSDFILEPIVNYKQRSSTTNNDDGFNEHSFQVNYLQPIKKHTLDLGASIIRRKNSSDYFYMNKDSVSSVFILDTSQSNSYHYQEAINAGYSSLTLKMGKWGMIVGARLEQAKINARFITSGTQTNQEYINLLPSMTILRRLKGTTILKFAYTQRLHRPGLSYLDPYVDLTDPYNISYGNPNLQPALTHAFNFAFTTFIKKTSININVDHQFTNNTIQQFTELSSDTVSRTTFGNIGQNKSYNLSLAGNTTVFKKLSINLNTNANYVQYSSVLNGKFLKRDGFTYTISGAFNFRLKDWRAGSSIHYNAPIISVQGQSNNNISHNITINKKLLKNNKANIGLSVSSPFQHYRSSSTEINDPAFYQLRESQTVRRRFTLSFNYRFTKVHAGSSD